MEVEFKMFRFDWIEVRMKFVILSNGVEEGWVRLERFNLV